LTIRSLIMTEYLLFLGFILILIAIFLWGWRQGFRYIQKLPGLTDNETAAIRHQMLALLGMPLFVLALALYRAKPYAFAFVFLIGFGPLGYIAMSSIRNRVSILQRRESLPIRGNKAVWVGIGNLVVILLALGLFLYYGAFK